MSNFTSFKSVSEFLKYRNALAPHRKIGFVPTMGALHDGHAELIKQAASECDLCVISIFVNPAQFNNPDDLLKYPRPIETDLKIAESNGAKIILNPEFEEIYRDNYRFQLTEKVFSKELCGAHRPGHFDGVLTVVMKLLQIVRPVKAYFGEKDFQQLQLIREMAEAFFLQTEIIACKTVRDTDGLALSSRNVRLSAEGRNKAPFLYKALTDYGNTAQAKKFLESAGINVEYLEDHCGRRYIAAQIDGVRLIDNVEIR